MLYNQIYIYVYIYICIYTYIMSIIYQQNGWYYIPIILVGKIQEFPSGLAFQLTMTNQGNINDSCVKYKSSDDLQYIDIYGRFLK